jgi:flagellar hook-associated protein 1 FlgK
LNAVGGPFDVVVNSGETDEPTSERIAAVVASKMRVQAPVPSITGAPIPSLPPVGSFSRFSLDGAEYVLESASTGLKITGPEEDRLVLNTENVYSGASSVSGEKVLIGQSITLSVSGGSVSGQAPTPKFDTNASLFGFGTGSTFTSGATVLSSIDPKVTHKAQSALQGRKFTLPSVGGAKTMNAFVNGFDIGITLRSNMPTATTNITAGTGASYNILTADNAVATTSLSATILGTTVSATVAAAAAATITSAEMDARSSALAAAINAEAGVGYDADAVSSSARPAATTIAINGTFSNTGNTHAGFDSAREVTVSSVSDESGVNFTISGTDMDGNTLTETIVGGTSNSTVATTEKFLTVSQVVSSARPAGNISLGIKLLTATGSTNGSGNVALSGDVVSLTTNETVGATQPATLSPASAVVITTLEDLSDKTFTITGTDANGATLTETVKGTSTGSTLTSGGLFASVTNVSLKNTTSEALASSTLNITIGISTDLDSIATATPANGSIPFTGSSAASNAFGSDGSIAHISGTTLKLSPTTATSSTTASIAIEGVMVTVANIQLANFVATPTSPNGDTSVTADSLTKANNYASRFATAINENTELVAKGLTATASLNGSGEVSVRRLTTSLYPMAKSTSIHLQADLINGPINITGSGAATSLGFKVAEANLLVTDDGLTANSTGGQPVEISGTGSSLAESRLQLSGLPKEELIVVIAGGGARRISAEYTILDTANVEPLKQENSYEVKMIDAASGRVELFDKATGHSIATRISNGNVQFDSDGIQFNLNGNSSTGDIFGVLTGQRSAGDARNMDNIMDLASTSVGRSSFQDDFRSIAAAVGSTLESSRLSKLSAEAVRDAAVAAEDEVSGVNMDEEAGKLISQQQAYQAAARILQTAKEMFDTLLRI